MPMRSDFLLRVHPVKMQNVNSGLSLAKYKSLLTPMDPRDVGRIWVNHCTKCVTHRLEVRNPRSLAAG